MTNELVEVSPFSSLENFEQAQRMAAALTTSSLVPQQYQGKDNIGNTLIALEMAQRTRVSVLSVMQNLYIVNGKPAWSSQYLIAAFNGSGKFGPITYVMNDEKTACTAHSTILATGQDIFGPEVTFEMAQAEGWVGKKGSKWQTMPELMLRYRAATFLVRQTAPELTMGMQTVEELRDVIDVTPVEAATEGLGNALDGGALPPSNIPTDVSAPVYKGGKMKPGWEPGTPVPDMDQAASDG